MFADFFLSFLKILCLLGRAVNIYPLSSLVNQFRDVKISRKTQFIMWFSGKFFFTFDRRRKSFLGSIVALVYGRLARNQSYFARNFKLSRPNADLFLPKYYHAQQHPNMPVTYLSFLFPLFEV